MLQPTTSRVSPVGDSHKLGKGKRGGGPILSRQCVKMVTARRNGCLGKNFWSSAGLEQAGSPVSCHELFSCALSRWALRTPRVYFIQESSTLPLVGRMLMHCSEKISDPHLGMLRFVSSPHSACNCLKTASA